MPMPVFILGRVGSRAEPLSRILAAHPAMAAPSVDPETGRFPGSAFFSHVQDRYGSLRDDANLIQCIEVLAAGRHFQALGLDKDVLYDAQPRTYLDAYKVLMRTHAERLGASHWLDLATSPPVGPEQLLQAFGSVRIVAVRRTRAERLAAARTIHSGPLAAACREKAGGLLTDRQFRSMAQAHPESMLLFAGEALSDDPSGCLEQVCVFLGLEPSAEMDAALAGTPGADLAASVPVAADGASARSQGAAACAALWGRFLPLPLYRSWVGMRQGCKSRPLPDDFFPSRLDGTNAHRIDAPDAAQ